MQTVCTALHRQHGLEDPVCVVDLGAVARLFRDWMAAMPRVVPFYAVKANNDEGILAMLAALGAGFDCASDAEVRAGGLHCIWLPAGDAHTEPGIGCHWPWVDQCHLSPSGTDRFHCL